MVLRHNRRITSSKETCDSSSSKALPDGVVQAKQGKIEEWKSHSMKRAPSAIFEEARGLHKIVESNYFSAAVGVLIGLNGVLIGVETDVDFESLGGEWHYAKTGVDYLFTTAFIIELILKLWVYRLKFFTSKERFWNILDLVLVSLSFLESFILSWATDDAADMGAFSVLRLFRLLKVVRLLKLLSMFKQLWFLVIGLANAMPVTFWGLFLTFFIIYMAAIYITRQLGTVVKHDGVMFEYWGSIGRSMFTLFQVATGDSWASGVVRPVLKHDPNLVLFFLGFVCVTQFAVLNVVVAVIVENVLKEALKTDEELVKEAESEIEGVMFGLFDIFRRMDLDSSGELTRDEFKQGLANTKVQARLQRLGISFEDAEDIFDILDHDKGGTIMLEEFIEGCMKSRGGAKAKDMLEVNCNMYQCMNRLNVVANGFEEQGKRLDVLADQVMELGKTGLPASEKDAGTTAMQPMPVCKSDSRQTFWEKVQIEQSGAVETSAKSLLQDVEQHFAKVQTSLARTAWFKRCPVGVAEKLLGLDWYLSEIEGCLAADSEGVQTTGSSSNQSSIEEYSTAQSSTDVGGSQTAIPLLPPPLIYMRPNREQTRTGL